MAEQNEQGQGGQGAGQQNATGGGQPGTSGQQPGQERVFTQAEVNALVGHTRQEERGKYADYEALKDKAAKFDEAETARLSDAEKAKKDKEAADARADAAIKTANERLLKAAFIAEAAKSGAKIPADAYALAIADGAQVSIDKDGNAIGVTEAVKALVDAGRLPMSGRPGAPGLDAGAGGQERPGRAVILTDEQKYFAKVSGMTEEQYITYLTAKPVRDVPDAGATK
jgi:hypothetical protein